MQKAIQIISSSSGFIFHRRLKYNNNNNYNNNGVISFTSVSSSSRSITTSSLLLPPTTAARRVTPFRPFVTRSDSNPDGTSIATTTSVAFQSSGNTRKINFCQWCGGSTKHEIPDGEEKTRAICTLCGKIAYENPKMVVGCLIEHENKVLLCKRNIQPSYGRWYADICRWKMTTSFCTFFPCTQFINSYDKICNKDIDVTCSLPLKDPELSYILKFGRTLPAGYMEMGESATEGAMRETLEEAGAEVQVLSPFAQLDIPRIGQTYIIFLAKLKSPHFSPGPESSECRLFALEDIPFDSLAFSSMVVTLNLYMEDLKNGRPKFHYGIINKRPGTSPSAIQAYTLDSHMQS